MKLLDSLYHLGFTVEAVGNRVQVRHPDPEPPLAALPLLDELRHRKAEVLETLAPRRSVEAVLEMPLSRFEREGRPIEIRVPWFEETLWFVPSETDAEPLAQKGVTRGRVWTAQELVHLHRHKELTPDRVRTIALAKAQFSGRVAGVSLREDRPGAAIPRNSDINDGVPPVRNGGDHMEAEMALKFRTSADGKPWLAEGVYSATLSKVEERTNDNGDFLLWTFGVRVNGKDKAISGTTSTYFTDKAKGRLWSEALLGRPFEKDEEIDLEGLYGKDCRVKVTVKQIEDGKTVSRVETVLCAADEEGIPF